MCVCFIVHPKIKMGIVPNFNDFFGKYLKFHKLASEKQSTFTFIVGNIFQDVLQKEIGLERLERELMT